MKPHKSMKAIACLFMLLFLSGCDETRDMARKDPPDRQADEAAIRSLLGANFAASTARDAAGVAATFMPDGDGWIVGLSRVATHEGIRNAEVKRPMLPMIALISITYGEIGLQYILWDTV